MAINKKDRKEIFNKAWPSGSYYFSTKNESPASFIGGEWDIVSGYFLKASSNSGGTGGSKTATLSNFCPQHSHQVGSHSHSSMGSHPHSFSQSHPHNLTNTSHTHSYSWNHSHSNVKPDTQKQILSGGQNGYRGAPNYNAVNSGKFLYTFAGNNMFKNPTATISSSSTISSTTSGGSGQTTGGSAGSIGSSSTWSLNTDNTKSSSFGTDSSTSIDIMPPHINCYCWRRR